MSKLTKQDRRRINLRHIFGLQLGWNYERMQGLGYYYSILPALKKIYADDPEGLARSAKMHLNFYNTNPSAGEVIIGMNLAIEENEGIEALETVSSLKTALMGPFAGIGDTVFGVIAGTIFGAIAANFAVNGQFTGMFLWILWNISVVFIRFKLFDIGYEQGTVLVHEMKDKLSLVTDSATIMGLIVVGALIPSTIKVKIPFVFTLGEISLNIQENLDKILLFLPQILVVFVCYKVARLKGMTSAKLILIVMVLAIALSYFKIISA